MAHIAFYRKWRPQQFQDVAGQNYIIRTLQNSLKDGRISHAYLFSGPRGTGKTSAARILAKAVNCEQGISAEPCNVCSSCVRITNGTVMDIIELDAASNRGIEDMREIREKVKYAPTESRIKVYIIDEVHMLTTEAFNGLLKTLEEPPTHVMFILATTEPHKLPATIISRCQRFDFRRVSIEEQTEKLDFICSQENITMSLTAKQYIARLSEGSMRDAVSLLDQVVSYSGTQIEYADVVAMTGDVAADQFLHLAKIMKERDIGNALEIIGNMIQEGKSADKCMESLIHYFRDMLLIKMIPDSRAVTERILNADAFTEAVHAFSSQEIFAIIDVLNHYLTEMKYSTQPQTLFELAVMKICTNDPVQPDSNELVTIRQQLDKLEQQVFELQKTTKGDVQQKNRYADPTLRGATPTVSTSTVTPPTGEVLTDIPTKPAVMIPTNVISTRTKANLSGFLLGVDSPDFKQIVAKWSAVLSQVKGRKITVHAWLVNGEPVSFFEDTVLLAFNSAMHRETTEKQANKQIIEQAMCEVFGTTVRFMSVMHQDWDEVGAISTVQSQEEMKLEPEQQGAHKEEWINQAIELFGEDLVEIKEN